jgi:hypothetical protein
VRATLDERFATGKCLKHGRMTVRVSPAPAEPKKFDGDTYDVAKDRARLNKQYQDVWNFMSDGQPHTLYEVAEGTGYPEQSVSARLRDFRKARNGAHVVERKRVGRGVHSYRLVPQ